MVKVFSGKEFKDPRGSLSNLRVSPPSLVMVVITFKFFDPSPLMWGAEVLTVTLGTPETAGAPETMTADAMRATREARREEKNIVVKVVKGVEGATPMKLEDWKRQT